MPIQEESEQQVRGRPETRVVRLNQATLVLTHCLSSAPEEGQRSFFVSAGFQEQNLSFLVKEAHAIHKRPRPS